MAEKEEAREKESIEKISEEKPSVKEVPEEVKKELEKTKVKLETFKKQLLKKFSFISALGLVPPQASKIVEEEEEIPEEEKKEKLIHVLVLLPDEKSKELGKVKIEAIKLVEKTKPKIWVHVKTIEELWEICFDSKYEYIEAIAMSYPLYDKGVLGALRVASIHKTLVLKKFEKYVVSYVIAGSLVRGEAKKTSDVDVYVVVDDTDVKRMSRIELKEKLRAIIYSYVVEASEIAGVKNKLSPQIYILTEFWEAVKDAHPVIFTFIRDGVPLYDRGAFMPWKLLLKMGKIKPSPEAIDMFMSLGEKISSSVNKKLGEIATEDLYWGVLTPSQAILMLHGIAPPTPKETIELMRKIFVEKEKLLEKKYIDILERIFNIYKEYEHEKRKKITGKEIDKLLEDSASYIKRLKQLMEQIEKKTREKTILQIYDDVFKLLQNIFGKKSEKQILGCFENELVKKGKIRPRALNILKKIIKAKKDYKKKKLTKHEVEETRKDASELINTLIEYAQRKDIASIEKKKAKIIYEGGKKQADLLMLNNSIFILAEKIKEIDKEGKTREISKEEFEKISVEKRLQKPKLNSKMITSLKKIFGEFELEL